MRLEDIEKSIKKYCEDAKFLRIKNEKLGRELLFVCSGGAQNRIQIYDEMRGINAIAVMMYSIRKDRVFVSEFEVNANYQENGLGRFMFDFAMAHADLLGATKIYGSAMPTNNFKSVKNKQGLERYEEEKTNLLKIYQRLGCTTSKDDDYDEYAFEQTWKSGEKIALASKEVKDLTKEMVLIEKERKL